MSSIAITLLENRAADDHSMQRAVMLHSPKHADMSEKKPDTTPSNDKIIRLTTCFIPKLPPPPPNKVVPKTRPTWWYGLIGLILVSVVFVIVYIMLSKPPVYIAMIGPMTGEDALDGIGMREGVELRIKDINQAGGINGRKVNLLVFDDAEQAETARAKAEEAATQTEVLGVIGHNTSATSLAASPIYQQYGLAAVTGSSTADAITRDNEWYFRVIFNNSDQAALAANYIQKVLKHEAANIIFVEDSFGKNLAESFISTSKSIGLNVENAWSFQPDDNAGLQRILATIDASLKQRSKAEEHKDEPLPLLFIATHSVEAIEIVTSLHKSGAQLPIMGADPLSNDSFLSRIQHYPQERARPGYFTEGLYMISPFLPDIASQRAQVFNDDFTITFYHSPSMISAMNYDATLVLLDAIKLALSEKHPPKDLKQLRYQVREKLSSYSTIRNSVEGVTGDLYFDQNRNIVKTIPVGVFQGGETINALEQFQPVQDLRRVDRLLEEALNNQIIAFNGKFMRRTQVVYTGIDFNELTELNPKDGTFKADFYLWFRFRDHFEEGKIDFINAATPIDLGKPIVETVSDGIQGKIITKTYRVRGKFKVNMNFADYPFDRQVLPIRFRHATLTREKLIYAVDTVGLQTRQLGKDGILGKFIKNNVFVIGGWSVRRVALFQNSKKNDSTLGVSETFGSEQRIEYSQFNAEVNVQRLVLSFVLKNLLPIVFLVILGYATFFISIPTTGFPVRMALGTNMIVTTSLFHLRLASNMPDIDYVVLIEYVFYCVYLLAIFSLGLSVGSYFLNADRPANFENRIKRLNLIGKIGYPTIVIVLITYIAITYG
jgi:branched-chain amino acid transport system substrate-binding protein